MDRRPGSGRIGQQVAGKAIVPAMYRRPSATDRPEWLPADWTMELKKRSKYCRSSQRIDKVIDEVHSILLESSISVLIYLLFLWLI